MKKDANKDKTTMTAQEVGVLIEDLRSQFRIFGEHLSTVKEDLSAVKKKVDAIFEEAGRQKEDVFIIKSDIRIIKNDIAEIKETLKSHDKRIAHLEGSVK